MKKTNVSFFESPSTGTLDSMVANFINENGVTVINASLTSCYNPAEEQIIYCVAITFSYEE